MEETIYSSLMNQYSTLMEQVNSMEPCIKLLERDLFLVKEKGYRLSFAIDFHELWIYAYPIAMFMQAGRFAESSDKDSLLRKQVARAALFYGLEPGNCAVLLPPYVIELNDKIAQVRAGLLKRVSQIDEGCVRQLDKITNQEPVRAAMAELQTSESGQIQPKLLQQLRLFLEENVNNLFFLMSGVAGQGLGIIRDLFIGDKPKVQLASIRWPELKEFVSQIMEMPNSIWHDRFKKIRKDIRYENSNMNDAKAIDLVLSLNQQLVDKHELLFIVSDTPAMESILKKKPYNYSTDASKNYTWTEEDGICVSVSGIQEPLPIFRPIEAFYYSLLFRADPNTDIKENLEDVKGRINQIHMLEKSIQKLLANCKKCKDANERDDCTFADECHNMQQQLFDHNEHFNKWRNVRLVINRLPVIQPYWNQVQEYNRRLNDSALVLIKYLSETRKRLDNGFRVRGQKLLEMMENEFKEALSIATDVDLTYKGEINKNLNKFSRTRYQIHFLDEKVATLLDDLVRARYTGDVDGITNAINQLMERAFQRDLGDERSLLWAVLLLFYCLYDRAALQASQGMENVDVRYKSEFYYLRVLALFEGGKFAQAITECRGALGKYINDPRFNYLYGMAMGKWQQDAPGDAKFSLDDSIKYISEAYDLAIRNIKYIDLQGLIANDLAYLYYLRNNSLTDLEEAFDYIEKSSQALQSIEKMPEYWNTRGCILWKLALQEKEVSTPKKYAQEALDNLDKAYNIAKTVGVDQDDLRRYEADIQEAKQQLVSLV